MRKIIVAVICTVIILGTITISHADIRSRVNEARGRIERGVQNGRLDRHEARILRSELDDIFDRIKNFRDDGHLDRRERSEINIRLDRLEREIKRKKNYNNDTRRHDRLR